MTLKRRPYHGAVLTVGLCFFAASPAAFADASNTAEVKTIFEKHCLECHGGRKTSAGVKVLDRDVLVNTKKKVVPNKPDASRLFATITTKVSADRMPPVDRTALTAKEIAAVKTWILEGAPAFIEAVKNEPKTEEPLTDLPPDDVPGIPVPKRPSVELPRDEEPAKPAPESPPTPTPTPEPKPTPPEKASPEKPVPVPEEDPILKERIGSDYIHQAIRADVARLSAADRVNARYFSLAHLLPSGIRKSELQQHRDAIFKGVNHLSWRRELFRPVPIDRLQVVYRVDLVQLGWNRPVLRSASGQGTPLNAWDLLLLDYPYGVTPVDDGVYRALASEYLVPSRMVRPIPCVRADWFVAAALQPPLYHHMLSLPRTLTQLEEGLGVRAQENIDNGKAVRAGVISSGVSNHNRVVERHLTNYGGYYWRSYDFKSSAGPRNILTDPVRLQPDGGEIIFQLPNGMQAYLIVDGQGNRIDVAPTEVVKDKNAADSAVRNGLACMRCHDHGMKRDFKDIVRPTIENLNGVSFDKTRALSLYRDWPETESMLKGDEEQFLGKLKLLLGREQETEPLQPVAARYLDEKLLVERAGAELGLTDDKGLSAVFRLPQFLEIGLAPLAAGQEVPREAWETNFDEVARRVGAGLPVGPFDAISRPNYTPATKPFALVAATNKKGDVFQPGEEMTLFLKASKDVFVEVIHTAADGKMTILAPSTAKLTARDTFRVPAQGRTIKVADKKGVETLTILASETPFVGGEVMNGFGVPNRVIHRSSMREEGGRLVVTNGPQPTRTVKMTLVVEVK